MRFATVAFAQSDLTIWYVAIVLPILILATIVTIWGNQITGKAGEHWASEELRKLPQSVPSAERFGAQGFDGTASDRSCGCFGVWHLRSGGEELYWHDLWRFQIF